MSESNFADEQEARGVGAVVIRWHVHAHCLNAFALLAVLFSLLLGGNKN